MAPRPVRQSDVVLYGGFREILHEEKGHVADLPFQWVAGRISSVDHDDIMLEPGFETMQWLGHDANREIRGWSGGPVFRAVENEPITRVELVGFMYVFVSQKTVKARHADVVLSDGHLLRN
jgi:hypothetical protein